MKIVNFWGPQNKLNNKKVKPKLKTKVKTNSNFNSKKLPGFNFGLNPQRPNSKKVKVTPIFNFGLKSNSKPVKRKDMNWTQAKARYPKLSPFGDTDRDGVKNWLDCKPFDKKRQGIYHLPSSKKKYRRRWRETIPYVLKSNKGKTIDVLRKKGMTSFSKIGEEKLADIQKDDPNVNYSKESIKAMEEGSSKGILARGRTPGKIIYKQSGEKKVNGKYIYKKDKYGRQVPVTTRRLRIYDIKTGDTELFEESGNWTKKELDEEKKDNIESEREYHPITEEGILRGMSSDMEIMNPHPVDTIKEKRKALRDEAWEKKFDKAYFVEPETSEAFKRVVDYDLKDEDDITLDLPGDEDEADEAEDEDEEEEE